MQRGNRVLFWVLGLVWVALLGCGRAEQAIPTAVNQPALTEPDGGIVAPGAFTGDAPASPPGFGGAGGGSAPPEAPPPMAAAPQPEQVAAANDTPPAASVPTGSPIPFRTPSGEPDVNEPIDAATNSLFDNSYDEKRHPELIALLAHRNPKVREKAAEQFKYFSGVKPNAAAIEPLGKLLVDPNVAVRKEAATAIARHKIYAEALVPALIVSLRDPEDDVLRPVIEALGQAGPKAAAAVPPLMVLLDKDIMGGPAAESLGQIGPAAQGATPKLVKLLPSWIARYPAARALGRLGAEKELLAAAVDKEADTREAAMHGLAHINPTNDQVIAALNKGVSDKDADVRQNALRGLGTARPTSDAIVTALASQLPSADVETRKEAVAALCKIDPKLDSAVPPLMSALKDADAGVRGIAAQGLAEYKSNPQARMAALLMAATDDAASARGPALSAIGNDSKTNYPLLLAVLKDEKADPVLLCGALAGLRNMYHNYERTKELTPLLEAVLQAPSPAANVPVYAAAAQLRIKRDTPGLDPIFIAGLKSPKADARRVSADCLGQMKSAAATTALVECLADANQEVLEEVVQSLGALEAEAAVTPLCKIVKNPESKVRSSAIKALGDIGQGGATSGPVLLALLISEDGPRISNLKEALAAVVEKSKLPVAPMVAQIVPLLSSKDDSARRLAANTIKLLPTPGCEAAIAPLIKLTEDKDGWTRDEAYEALEAHGSIAAAAAGPLLRALAQEKDEYRRVHIIAALGTNASEAPPIVAALTQALGGGQKDKVAALKALELKEAAAAPAVAAVSGLLSDGEAEVRRAAIVTLGSMGSSVSATTVPPLLKVVQEDPDTRARMYAAQVLMKIAPDNPAVLSGMAILLKSDDYSVRSLLTDLKEKLSPVLAAGLKHNDAAVRAAALKRLSQMENQQEAAAAYLVAVKDQDVAVRSQAAKALAEIGGYDAAIAPILIESLSEESSQRALRNMGRGALPAITAVLNDLQASAKTKANACQLLTERGHSSRKALAATMALRDSSDENLRTWATLAAASLDQAQRQGPLLVPLLKSKDPKVRAAALKQLAHIHGGEPITNEKATALLITFLTDGDEEVREAAAEAVGYCELKESHVPALTAALHSEKGCDSCMAALFHGRPLPQGLAEPLLKMVSGKNEDRTHGAVYVMSQIGPGAVEPLLALARDSQVKPQLRQLALAAVGRIERVPATGLKGLAELVKGQDQRVRVAAAAAMAQQGVAHPKVLEALVAGIALIGKNSKEEDEEDEASGNLIQMGFAHLGTKAAPVIPQLVALLKSENAATRRAAAECLIYAGPDSDVALSALVDALIADKEVGQLLTYRLHQCHARAIPHVMKALDSRDPRAVRDAAISLRYFGEEAKAALPKLKEVLLHKDASALAAAELIARLDPKTEGVLPLLMLALDGTDQQQHEEALDAIGAMKEFGAPATERLIKMLDGRNASSAAEALAGIGPPAAAAVPALLAKLKTDQDFDAYARALGSIGPAAKEAAPILIANFNNDHRFDAAAEALARIGPAGDAAVPLLVEMLQDEAKDIIAARALAHFGTRAAPALPALTAMVTGGDRNLGWSAAEALGAIGEPAQGAAPQLMAALETGPSDSIQAAAHVLEKLKSPALLPRLVALLSSADDQRSNAAASALAGYGPAASPGVEALTKNLSNPKRASQALRAIKEIGPAAAAAVPALVKLAADSSENNLYYIVECFGSMGPAAQAALPQLEPLLKSNDAGVRDAAGRAIWKIDPARGAALGVKKPAEK